MYININIIKLKGNWARKSGEICIIGENIIKFRDI